MWITAAFLICRIAMSVKSGVFGLSIGNDVKRVCLKSAKLRMDA